MSLFARGRRPLRFGTTFVLMLFIALGFVRLPLLAADVPDPNALRITPVVPPAAPKPATPPISTPPAQLTTNPADTVKDAKEAVNKLRGLFGK